MAGVKTAQGTLRGGPFRKLYKRAKNEEIRARVEYCAQLLSKLKTRGEIYKIFFRRYGLDPRTVDCKYIRDAKQWLVDRANMSRTEAKRLGINILLDIIRETRNDRVRIMAEARLSLIFGYDAPRHIETTAVVAEIGNGEDEALKRLSTERLRTLLSQLESNGHDNEPLEVKALVETTEKDNNHE